ncbi:MAG: GFA family protein [Oceanicaulis sp.]
MIEGACHCGALSWRTPARPAHLTRCTCSACRRYAALWGEVDPAATEITGHEHARDYVTGDASLAFVFCSVCGNLSHWRSLPGHGERMKLNFRLADPAVISGLRVRTFDGADSWAYLD